jgi:hypothetical protein
MTWIFNYIAVTTSRLTCILQCILFKCILWDTPISTANNWYKYYNQQVNILHFFLYMLHIKVTHWIYSFTMCFLFTCYIYLIYFICLFIYLYFLLGSYTTHCIIAQKCAVQFYFILDTWNHAVCVYVCVCVCVYIYPPPQYPILCYRDFGFM